MNPVFLRRLAGPWAEPSVCQSTYGCPDLWEMTDGDFAVIGEDITALAAQLPSTAGCGPGERMVRVPRELLIRARAAIPEEV
jgi:hypothetical protein